MSDGFVSNGMTFDEFKKYIDSVNSSITTGVATFLEEVSDAQLTEAQRLQRLGNYYAQQFATYSSKAREFASKAQATNNTTAARIWGRIADTFDSVAAEREVLGTQKWTEARLNRFIGTFAKVGGVAGIVIDVAQISIAVTNGDYDRLGEISTGIFYGTLGAVAGGAFVALLGISGLWIPAVIIGLTAYLGTELGQWVWRQVGPGLQDFVSDLFNSAQIFLPRRDPLTFDLDGDGIETLGIDPNSPILFDHTGDGVKTATGWIAPDDAFLVLDRNGNGTIDDGTELFGDSTPLFDSEGNVIDTAADGFAALAQEDTNGDGVVDANDARFNDLRLWRDDTLHDNDHSPHVADYNTRIPYMTGYNQGIRRATSFSDSALIEYTNLPFPTISPGSRL